MADLLADLIPRLEALIERGWSQPGRDEPGVLDAVLELHRVSARLDLLIETLEARRRAGPRGSEPKLF